MIVYILEFMDYDDFRIVGVFTSLEKAISAQRLFMDEHPKYGDENFEITQHEVK